MAQRKVNKDNTRSPLKDSPLRNPGQSLDEQIQQIMDGEVSDYFFISGYVILMAMYEWARLYYDPPPHPVLFTIIALIVVGFSARKLYVTKRTIKRLRLGRDGERFVGQFLEDLREKGFKVIHDIIGKDFNIDHVIIGPQGVFTIETKTISKPAKGRGNIHYDGEHIIRNGYKPDAAPIIQAKAEAHWLKNLIFESTGRHIHVTPVVVYPGWFVESTPNNYGTGASAVWA